MVPAHLEPVQRVGSFDEVDCSFSEAAARAYFKRGSEKLTSRQAALLAAIVLAVPAPAQDAAEAPEEGPRVAEAVVGLVRDMHAARKPIGAVCIAPALIASAFKGTPTHPELTPDNGESTIQFTAPAQPGPCQEVRARPAARGPQKIRSQETGRRGVDFPSHRLAHGSSRHSQLPGGG